jgi:hypothetical protein
LLHAGIVITYVTLTDAFRSGVSVPSQSEIGLSGMVAGTPKLSVTDYRKGADGRS